MTRTAWWRRASGPVRADAELNVSPDPPTWLGADGLWHGECDGCGARYTGTDPAGTGQWSAAHRCDSDVITLP